MGRFISVMGRFMSLAFWFTPLAAGLAPVFGWFLFVGKIEKLKGYENCKIGVLFYWV